MIFALPLYDDNPIRRTPVVTYALVGMCIGAFLWQLGQDEDIVAFQFGMVPAVLFGYRALPPELAIIPPWATIFTSMFLHAGWAHLGGNMLFLWIFGNNVEDLLGRARYLSLYLSCGAAAAVAARLSQEPQFEGKTFVVVLPDSGERYLSSALFTNTFDPATGLQLAAA